MKLELCIFIYIIYISIYIYIYMYIPLHSHSVPIKSFWLMVPIVMSSHPKMGLSQVVPASLLHKFVASREVVKALGAVVGTVKSTGKIRKTWRVIHLDSRLIPIHSTRKVSNWGWKYCTEQRQLRKYQENSRYTK